jgi:hypothetical protein
MKQLLAALLLSAVAFAANTGSVTPGTFYAKPGETANLRFEFKLSQGVLFNRAGSSNISFTNPFTGKPVELEISKGTVYAKDPADYFESLEPLVAKLSVPSNAKPGVYPVQLEAEMFLCDGVIKVCYREVVPGKLELRLGQAQAGKDAPVLLEFVRAQR